MTMPEAFIEEDLGASCGAESPSGARQSARSGARLVVLESPYAATNGRSVVENVEYARLCMADSLRRGEAPIASHLLYTQPGILDDDKPEERGQGIEAGLLWARHAEAAVAYTDYGITAGMRLAIAHHEAAGVPVEYRALAPEARTSEPATTPPQAQDEPNPGGENA